MRQAVMGHLQQHAASVQQGDWAEDSPTLVSGGLDPNMVAQLEARRASIGGTYSAAASGNQVCQ